MTPSARMALKASGTKTALDLAAAMMGAEDVPEAGTATTPHAAAAVPGGVDKTRWGEASAHETADCSLEARSRLSASC